MARYPPLPASLREMLEKVEPSRDGELLYFPCKARLRDGSFVDTVYVESEGTYIKYWGVYPEDDKGKLSVKIDDVVAIESSPTRMPPRFANEIYRNGESGMGYVVFTVLFADGEKQACVSGNAVDFIRYPAGKGPQDVVGVIPHEGRRDDSLVNGPGWYWCLYSE
jgi:hypothetical protein